MQNASKNDAYKLYDYPRQNTYVSLKLNNKKFQTNYMYKKKKN